MKRVLIVEPDRSLRNQVQAMLEHHGYKVVHALDYDDALLVLSFSRVDLLIFGRNLPEEEKPQMALELREDGIVAPIISLRAGGAQRLHPQIDAELPCTARRKELSACVAQALDGRLAA